MFNVIPEVRKLLDEYRGEITELRQVLIETNVVLKDLIKTLKAQTPQCGDCACQSGTPSTKNP